MKKLLLATLVVGVLAGCSDTGVPVTETNTYKEAAEANEKAIASVINGDTLPKIERSLERENIKRRIEFINLPDRVGYLYLLSNNGQLVKEVQVKGKVSSLNSYLTPMEEIKIIGHDGDSSYHNETPVAVSAADVDGTWGENDAGIFWFTPDGVYQEWTGLYMYSSERMSFKSQPILTEVVGNE